MKTILSLSALLITLTLTAQSNPATWYLNDTSGNGIQDIFAYASGNYSFAMGDNATSSGFNSRALGINTTASGEYSTAIGFGGIASGKHSTAMGSAAYATGNFSTVIGTQSFSSGLGSVAIGGGVDSEGLYSVGLGGGTLASGNYSTAMGYETTASGDYSTALGENTTASGNHSTAVGYNSNATGTYSVAIGATNNSYGYASTTFGDSNLATGRASTAIGAGTIAEDYGMLSIGVWSSPLSQPNPDQFSYNNTALLIGNGPDADNRSNALQVLFDGTTTIAGDLNVNSDARLKANIVSLGGTLAKLLQIDGKTYTMKKDENKKQKIGVLAQDIEKVFPELVSESNGIKSVNYQGLVPVLINALKEQDSKINEQEARIERLEKLLLNS